MNKFWRWITSSWPLLLVVLIGGFLRFYHLRDLTTFGGDQGVDYQIVAKMIATGKPTLLGPVTHVGVYLGPLYYYLLVPFFLLFRFDPIAAPVMFTLFGTATVGLVFILTKSLLRSDPDMYRGRTFSDLNVFAFLTALLYAASPVVLESSRAPSQPHLIPFFVTLLLISLLRIINRVDTRWDWLAIGISLAATIQFHFLTFPLWIVTMMALILNFKKRVSLPFGKDTPYKIFWLIAPVAILLFPWFLFELRHNLFITNQIIVYLQSGEVGIQPIAYVERVLDLIWFSFDRLIGQDNQLATTVAIILSLFGFMPIKSVKVPFGIITIYVLINTLGISLYSSPFSNHYISSLYPVIILSVSLGAYTLFGKRLRLFFIIFMIIFNFSKNDLTRSRGYTMPAGVTTSSVQLTSRIIAGDVKKHNRSFNVVNTLDGDTRANPYRYVLTYNENVVPLGPEDYPVADYLYVISRDSSEQLLKDHRWELMSFPVGEINNLGEINQDIKLYSWFNGMNNGKDLRR